MSVVYTLEKDRVIAPQILRALSIIGEMDPDHAASLGVDFSAERLSRAYEMLSPDVQLLGPDSFAVGVAREVFIPVQPMGAPRQSQSDKWKVRPVVGRYRAYRDEILYAWRQSGYEFPERGGIFTFYMPMFKSWSKKKKAAMDGMPHEAKPDADNLVKALLDSIYRDAEDSVVSRYTVDKLWVYPEFAGIEIQLPLYS